MKKRIKGHAHEKHVAYHEREVAIQAFADAMRSADIDFIAHKSQISAFPPETANMFFAMNRYIVACQRISERYAKKA